MPKPPQKYQPVFYTHLEKVDCDYLNRFFRGENIAAIQETTLREDRYYIEILTNSSRYVLLFESWNSYGKIWFLTGRQNFSHRSAFPNFRASA